MSDTDWMSVRGDLARAIATADERARIIDEVKRYIEELDRTAGAEYSVKNLDGGYAYPMKRGPQKWCSTPDEAWETTGWNAAVDEFIAEMKRRVALAKEEFEGARQRGAFHSGGLRIVVEKLEDLLRWLEGGG